MLNPENPAHAAAAARLRDDLIIWLTTVSPSGQPQTSPVWFLWDGAEFLIFGSAKGPKTPNIRANPHVSLNLDGNGQGGGIVVFEGNATVDADGPAAGDVPAYMAKYGERITAYGWDTAKLATDYPHVIRVTPTRARIW
ncbi:MAG TPA: TIGR03667 family PPOX class F420-dependent oxidoreductase [Streptosporangiaceae bacterium]